MLKPGFKLKICNVCVLALGFVGDGIAHLKLIKRVTRILGFPDVFTRGEVDVGVKEVQEVVLVN